MCDSLLERNYERGNCQRSARVEIAHVSRCRVGRRITIRDAACLILQLCNRRLVRFGRRGEATEDRSTTALAGDVRGNGLIVELLIPTRQADEGEKTAGTGLIGHGGVDEE